MRYKTLQAFLVLAVLVGMLLTPPGTIARLVGNEFQIVRYNFHEAWTGNIAFESDSNKVVIAWAEQSQLGYYAEPYVGWDNLGAAAVAKYRVATMTTHSSSIPDISCEIPSHCLITWVSGGEVFARMVRSDGTMGPLWQVDYGQPALRSVVARGPQDYVIVWEMDDGRIAMRRVDRQIGTLEQRGLCRTICGLYTRPESSGYRQS